jgi:hypothetical protein
MPEDKAPLLPCPFCGGIIVEVCCGMNEFWVLCKNLNCEANGLLSSSKDAAIKAWNKRSTLPPQSPDQGAVDKYFNITSDLIGNGCEHGFKPAKDCPNKDCDKAKAHKAWEALTRPPLDLAETKMEITKAALAGEVFIINLQDIDATLDHLQAIRPDLFGGKE